MRYLAATSLFATTLVTITTIASAETRDACTKTCETTAKSCFSAAYVKHDTCQPAANKGCATVPPANKLPASRTLSRNANGTNRQRPANVARPSTPAARPAGRQKKIAWNFGAWPMSTRRPVAHGNEQSRCAPAYQAQRPQISTTNA